MKSLFKYAKIFMTKLASEDDFSEFEDKLFKTPEKESILEESKTDINFDIKSELDSFIEYNIHLGNTTSKQPKDYDFRFGAITLPNGNSKTVLDILVDEDESNSKKIKLVKKYLNNVNEIEDIIDKMYIKLNQFINEEKLVALQEEAYHIGGLQTSKKGIAKKLLPEYQVSLEKNYKKILDSLKLNDKK